MTLERLGFETLFSYRSGGILTVEALESILFLAPSLQTDDFLMNKEILRMIQSSIGRKWIVAVTGVLMIGFVAYDRELADVRWHARQD